MDFYKGTIPIVDDHPSQASFVRPRNATFGLIPRDYDEYPPEMFESPDQMHLIDESEWDARYDEQEATQSSLEHLYLQGGQPAFLNLDQDGTNYCWLYSTGHAMMMNALIANDTAHRLNPAAAGAIIMQGRNDGGWCGLSAKWARENGYAVDGTGPGQWPGHSLSLRHDTPELRAAMKRHRTTEEWVDLSAKVYNQRLSRKQFASALLSGIPCPCDWNFWRHSVCAIRWVRIEAGSWGPLILNSWKGWGRFGLAVIRNNNGTPDGALAIRAITPSLAA